MWIIPPGAHSLSILSRKLIFGVCIITVILTVQWAPDMFIPSTVPLALLFLVTRFWLGLSSCRHLLGIWFGEGVIFAACGATAIYDFLPNQIVNEPMAYGGPRKMLCIFPPLSGQATREVSGMAKQGMARPDRTKVGERNTVPPVPELQGKARHGNKKANPVIAGTESPAQKVFHKERSR